MSSILNVDVSQTDIQQFSKSLDPYCGRESLMILILLGLGGSFEFKTNSCAGTYCHIVVTLEIIYELNGFECMHDSYRTCTYNIYTVYFYVYNIYCIYNYICIYITHLPKSETVRIHPPLTAPYEAPVNRMVCQFNQMPRMKL